MSHRKGPHGDSGKYWLDNPSNVDKVVYALYATCALLFGLDFFVHRHAEVGFDAWYGFYGWFGFIACVGLVLAARALRVILKRDEDYYDG